MEKKIVIITGATGGIGHPLALGFLEAGFKVIAIDHKLHRPLPEEITFLKVDLTDAIAIEAAFETIEKTFQTAHVLINNAAISFFLKPLHEITLDDWNQVMNVNFRAAFLCSQAFTRLNKGQTYGRIINMASTRYHQNEPGWDLYGASKGGLISLTNSLCVSLSQTPITVNAISPGWIKTVDYEALSEEDHRQHPSGRVGKPSDILRACLFLVDENNDFINGANLVIDGGMTKRMFYE